MTLQDLESRSTPSAGIYDTGSQLQRHIYRRYEAALATGDAARATITTREQLAARQQWLRERFMASLGGLPASDTPLNARVVGTVARDGYRIEKVIFESRPGVFVTTNLYLPDGITTPRAAVLFVCGHAQEAKHWAEYQIVCQALVRAGLVVLAQDPVGQGERFSYYESTRGEMTVSWGTTEHDYAGSQCLPLGDAIGRYFVHDAMRSIDYLCTRPEVDPQRIGLTGNSGGGTQTTMMMLCEPRLAAAAPATFVMDIRSWIYSGGAQDAEQLWPGFVGDGCDHEDLLLIMAPKPVLVLAVTHDFFPIEGTRRTVAHAARWWQLHGKPDRLALFEDQVNHQYSRKMAVAAAAFFSHHLLGKRVTPDAAKLAPLPSSQLWCTTSGQVRGEIEGARFVFEENRDRLAEAEQRRPAPEEARAWLRERVFAYRTPCDLNPRPYDRGSVQELDASSWMWWSQEDLLNSGVLLRWADLRGQDLPVTLAVWPQGTNDLQSHRAWLWQACEAGRAVFVLDPTGVGGVSPNPLRKWDDTSYGVSRVFSDDLVWLGDSMTALRTYDVLRAVEMLSLLPGLLPDGLQAYGFGRYAHYLQLAAALDPRLAGLTLEGNMESYASWVGARHYDASDIRSIILPGILRHLDLPDLGAKAPLNLPTASRRS